MRGVKRTDWDVASLFARWGMIRGLDRKNGLGHKKLSLVVTICLPWPDNKWPVLQEHLKAYGIPHGTGESVGWSSKREWRRPQRTVMLHAGASLRFFESINWSCGHPRRDIQMATWRRLAANRELERRMSVLL